MFTSDIDKVITLQEDLRKRFIHENTVLRVNRQQTQGYGVGDDDYSAASRMASFQLAPSLFHQQYPHIRGSRCDETLGSSGKTTRQFFDAGITDAYRCLHDTSFIKRVYFTYNAIPLLTSAESIQQQLNQLSSTAADTEVASAAATAASNAVTQHDPSEDAELQEFLQQHNKRQQQQQLLGDRSTGTSTLTMPVEDTLFPSQQRRKRKIDLTKERVNRLQVMRRLFTSQVDTEACLSLTSIEQFGDTNYTRTQHRRTYILNPLDVATANLSPNNTHQQPQRQRRQRRTEQQRQQQHPSDEKVVWGWENKDPIVRPYGGKDDDANKYSFDATKHWTDTRLRLVDTWIGTTANEFMDNEQCSGGAGARRRTVFNNSGIMDIDDETVAPLFVSRGTQQRITEFILERDNGDNCDLLDSMYMRVGGDEDVQQIGLTSTLLPIKPCFLRYGVALASAESSVSVPPTISAQLFGDCANGSDFVACSSEAAASLFTPNVMTDKRLPHLSISGIVGSRYNYVERIESARLGGCAGITNNDDDESSGVPCVKHSWRVPRFTSIRKFQNRLALMCVNTSRLLYTVDFFRFAHNYDYTDDTLTLYALNYYLDFDIGIADRVFAARRRRQHQPQKSFIFDKDMPHNGSDSDNEDEFKKAQALRKQHFAVVTHLFSLTGYEEYVFGLAYLLAFNVDVILGSEHVSTVHRYTHKHCANFCNEDSEIDLVGLSGNQTAKVTRRMFSNPDSQGSFDAEQRPKKQRSCAPSSEASSSRINGYVNVFVDQDRWYVKLSKTPLFV